jgi:GMP synthase (glutamine-hydrolysing)
LAKVLAVNNYPTRERFARLVAALEGNGADVATSDWKEVSAGKFGGFDGVVLSGSPDMMSEPRVQAKFTREVDAIRDSPAPLLGVCFGHQMIAHAFGSQVVKDGEHVLRMVETRVLRDDPLFDGLPRSLMLLESRQEVVKGLPRGFMHLARSSASEVAAMKHDGRPLYGVQSHPERYTKGSPDGNTVLGNFLRILG